MMLHAVPPRSTHVNRSMRFGASYQEIRNAVKQAASDPNQVQEARKAFLTKTITETVIGGKSYAITGQTLLEAFSRPEPGAKSMIARYLHEVANAERTVSQVATDLNVSTIQIQPAIEEAARLNLLYPVHGDSHGFSSATFWVNSEATIKALDKKRFKV